MTVSSASWLRVAMPVMGWGLLGMGLLLNEWLLAAVLSSDGVLNTANRVLIGVFDLSAVAIGLYLLLSKKEIKSLFRLVALGFLILAGLIAAELILRALEPAEQTLQVFEEHPGFYKLRPNLDYEARVGDGTVTIRTNSLGMHWREVKPENPDGRIRIAFVGDSFTFGCWASTPEQGFAGVFESRLDASKYEVLNFGVCGYGLGEILPQVEEEVLPFGPRYVVYGFFTGNDVRDAWLGPERYIIENGVARWNAEYLQRKIPGDYYEPPSSERWSVNPRTARLYQLLIAMTDRMEGRPPVLYEDFSASNSLSNYAFWSSVPYPPVAEEAIQATVDSIERLRSLLAARGARLVVVAIPTRSQVYATEEKGGHFDITLPQGRVAAYAGAHDVPYLDLLPAMRHAVREENRRAYVANDPHWNDLGHQLAGEMIAEFFFTTVFKP